MARKKTPQLDRFVADRLGLYQGLPPARVVGTSLGTLGGGLFLGLSAAFQGSPSLLPALPICSFAGVVGAVIIFTKNSASRLEGLSRTAFTSVLAKAVGAQAGKVISASAVQFLEESAVAYWTVKGATEDAFVIEAAEKGMKQLVMGALNGEMKVELRETLVELADHARAAKNLSMSPDAEARDDLREALSRLEERQAASEELRRSLGS